MAFKRPKSGIFGRQIPAQKPVSKFAGVPVGRHVKLPTWANVAGIIVSVVAIVLLLLPSGGQRVYGLSSAMSLSMAPNAAIYYSINGGTYALYMLNSSDLSSTFYVTKVPVLSGAVSRVILSVGESANVSGSGTSVADVNLRLSSASVKGANVTITPLPSVVSARPSMSVVVMNPEPLNLGGSAGTVLVTNTVTSTTVSTTVTTTVAANQTQANMATAFQIADNSTVGQLLDKFRALYVKGRSCTAGVYNTTYDVYYHVMPSGVYTFANMSAVTPTDVTHSVTKLSSALYTVTYNSVTPTSSLNGPMLQMEINITAYAPIVATSFVGILQGANYTALNTTYTFQSRILNNCSAYVQKP